MTQGFGGFSLLWGSGWGCGCGVGCTAGDCNGLRCVLLCLPIMMQIKMLNSIKNSPLSLFRKSLWCVAGIFAVTNDVFLSARGGLYSDGLIPTPGFNQSSRGDS